VTALDRMLPSWDWRQRHERTLPVTPQEAVTALLASPAAPDGVVRALLRLRGLRTGTTIEDAMARMGFQVLHRAPTEVVVGAVGTPWRPGGGIRPFAADEPRTVRIAMDVRAEPAAAGCVLSTETRIAATDGDARRAFGRYWRVVGPFSALIRRRWLAAAERTAFRPQ
jgi:hypothetical protein